MREIKLDSEDITIEVEGYNEIENRIPVLKRIHAKYALNIPPGSRETVDRALERHVSKCPTAQTLVGAVEVTWEAEISEQS